MNQITEHQILKNKIKQFNNAYKVGDKVEVFYLANGPATFIDTIVSKATISEGHAPVTWLKERGCSSITFVKGLAPISLHKLHDHDGHINTYSGRKINLFAPTADQICLIDIAKGLAYNPHFGGQTPKYFSIAQHSMLVEELCPERTDHRKLLAALLHDAPEAYMGDMLKPLKIHMDLYVKLEKQLSKVIFEKYKLPIELLKEVKLYDLQAQEYEYDNFYKNKATFHYWDPEQALKKFIDKIVDNEYFAANFNKVLEFIPDSRPFYEGEKKCWLSSKQ